MRTSDLFSARNHPGGGLWNPASVSVLKAGRTWSLDRVSCAGQNDRVSQEEVDAYLANLEQPKRATLQELRRTIRSIVPEAEEIISYGLPAFRLQGRVVAGFAAFKNHLSYLPHSGSVLAELPEELSGYATSKGALQFPIDKPLSKALVKKLIDVRLREFRQR